MLKLFFSGTHYPLSDDHAAVMVDLDWRITDVIHTAASILKTTKAAIRGECLREIIKLDAEKWKALTSNTGISRINPSAHPALVIEKIPQKNWLGQTKSYLILLSNINEQKALKEKDVRTQAFVEALSTVADKINQTENVDIILNVLEKALSNLRLGYLIIRLDEHKKLATIEHLTSPNSVLKAIQKTTGVNLRGYTIGERYWKPLANEYFFQRKTLFIENVIEFTPLIIPKIQTKHLKKALEISLGHAQDKAAYLPLIEENVAYGILGIWGRELKESDIPFLKIFAAQVSSILKSTETIKKTAAKS